MTTIDFRRTALQTSQSLVIASNRLPDHPIVFVNPAFTVLTGYTAEECIGRNCRFLQGPETDVAVLEELRAAFDAGEPVRRTLLNYRKDGTAFWNDMAIDPIRDARGRVVAFVAVQHDCTQAHEEMVARREAESRLLTVVNTLPGFLFETLLDRDGRFQSTFVSSAATRSLGLPGDGSGQSNVRLGPWIALADRRSIEELMRHSARTMDPVALEFRVITPVGTERWFRAVTAPQLRSDGRVAWSGLALEAAADLVRAHADGSGMRDPTTSLVNGPLFRTALVQGAGTLRPDQDHMALFHVNLDEFQAMNDMLGLAAADRVLRRVGLRLAEFAEARAGIACRLGGDEFTVMVPGLTPAQTTAEALTALADRIRAFLGASMWLENQEVFVSCCVGTAASPQLPQASPTATREEWADSLMKRAQVALLAAKVEGAGLSRVHLPALDDRVRHRQVLRQSLHRAINEAQFELQYQPQVSLVTGAIVGVEALLRWNHPELGQQRPDLFIPIAESSGLIVPLGAWVARAAMQQHREWTDQGLVVPRIALNVSSVQLHRPGFLQMMADTLQDTGAQASDFELELTEGTLLESTPDMKEQLQALKAMGFSLAIDDFGVGHSTFKYLRDFPMDRLKIDQTFVRQLVSSSKDVPIIRAMLSLAKALGLAVVAEGIETETQADFLRTEGCPVGQGYLFSKPISAQAAGALLAGGTTRILSSADTARA